ncbi:MAG: cbb3-type cytochrome c oxidase N-terminal domain-containing protein [Bacteroidia bacterium]
MRKFKITLLAILPTLAASAQETTAPAELNSVWSNPTFIVLAITALVLLAVILSLSATMRNLAESNKESNKSKSTSPIPVILILAFLGSANSADAQNWMPPTTIGGLDSWIFVLMALMIVIEFIMILTMIRAIKNMLIGLGFQKEPDLSLSKPVVNWKWLDRLVNDAVPVENEAEVMTDHEYDGIRELDNNLPPWWIYGFYFTIIFGVVYLLDYHVFQTSPLPAQEYQEQLAEAELEKKDRLKDVAASVDESNVIAFTDAAMLASGKEIYTGNCVSCHGEAGEGGVGPNLTDEFWIHGGGIKNIFKTIKYGVPAKGMIAWQTQLNPESMQKVSSYLLTFQGTKPANAKEAQGEIWVEEAVMPADSTSSEIPDSTSSPIEEMSTNNK